MHRILTGDVAVHLPALDAESFDACLCDPPYGLGFMGKAWDHGVPAADTWREVYRVLKPGAFLLAFGGTRTFHRLAVAIEDAGFEIRDCLSWMYGQGFPKSLDISKAIDKAAGAEREVVGRYELPDVADGRRRKGWDCTNTTEPGAFGASGQSSITAPATDAARRWQGYGTALKPAWEPIIVAMKPLDGTFAQNAVEYGVAGLNIDGCRIGTNGEVLVVPYADPHKRGAGAGEFCIATRDTERMHAAQEASIERTNRLGRWPANVILDEEAAAMLDEQSGDRPSGSGIKCPKGSQYIFQRSQSSGYDNVGIGGDRGGASRFFYCAKASRKEREAGLREAGLREEFMATMGDGIGAREHNEAQPGAHVRNHHPTVKPVAVAEWLARLILPPARETPRRLLVPFSGSGSEMIGALRAGWNEVTGIETEAEYVAIALSRIELGTELESENLSAPQESASDQAPRRARPRQWSLFD